MLNRGYRNHRKYLVARIDVLRHEVKHGGHAARVQAHLILARLLDELDDLDAAAKEMAVKHPQREDVLDAETYLPQVISETDPC